MALDFQSLQDPFWRLRKVLMRDSEILSPEDVHSLRTQTRRVEAIVRASMLDQKRDGRSLLEVLKPVRKAAGAVRDMDVFIGFASSLAKKSQDVCHVKLLEYLMSRRSKHMAELDTAISKRRQKVRRSLEQCLKLIEKKLGTSGKTMQNGLQVATNATARSFYLEVELSSWPKLNAGNMHAYRLRVKELRYILQLIKGGDLKFVAALGDVKDEIGLWHDWSELASIADEILITRAARKLRRQITYKEKEEFDKALTVTNAMREKFLDGNVLDGRKRRPTLVRLKASVVNETLRLAG